MPSFDEKPTVESIIQMANHLEKVWQDAHNRWKIADEYYNRDFPLWNPGSNRPVFHPAKSRSVVDTAVDQLLGFEPQVERFPEKVDQKEAADSGELAIRALFHQTSLLEPSLTFKEAGKNLTLYGYAVIEDDVDSFELSLAREDAPEQDKGESDEDFERREALWTHRRKTVMPFRNRAPHPADVLLDPSQKQPRIAIKRGEWYADDLYRITKGRLDENGEARRGEVTLYEFEDKPFDLIRAFEYWTDSWHALMVRGAESQSVLGRIFRRDSRPSQMLILEPNTWGFVPFSHAFAGFGHQPTNTLERNPKHLAVGMLDAIMDDLLMDAQRTSGKHAALMEATFAKRGTTEDPAEIEEQESTSETIELPNRGALWYLELPQLPAWLRDAGVDNDRDMEEATFSRSISGAKIEGVSTVGQQAILSTSGHRRFIALIEQLSHLATKSAEHFLQLIDILDLDLTIEGNRINRKLVNSDYSVKVTFQVADPVLKLQERQQAFTELTGGAMSLETYWSISGRGDATGERRRMWQDQVFASPQINAEFVRLEAQKMGLERFLVQQESLPPGGGPPGTGTSQILGPDGQPLPTTLGTQGPQQAVDQLRDPLTPQIASPSRTGQNRAG